MSINKFNQYYMQQALLEASRAKNNNEVPVGCVIVDYKNDEIIAAAHNMTKSGKKAILHAEMIAITKACEVLQQEKLNNCDIYVSLEPCPMCAHAISLVHIRRLYFAATDVKSGGVLNGPLIYNHSCAHHKPEIYEGIMAGESAELLKKFFIEKR